MKAALNSTAAEIARACGGSVAAGDVSLQVNAVSSDSRDTGDGCLFVALKGERFDGHDFIPELISRRAVSAVLSERDDFAGAARINGVTLIKCSDTLAALGSVASFHRSSLDTDVVAVTGTNGKTTTKELLHAVLSSRYRTHKNEKNYNNEIGVPFSVFSLNGSHEKAVFELGMNHPGEISRLSRIVRPRISVITSVGEGHLEFLGSVRNVALAKMEIIQGMEPGGLLVLNRDTQYFDMMSDMARAAGFSVKTFGLGEDAQVRPGSYRLTRDSLELAYAGEEISVPLYGVHNVYNMLAVIAVAEELDVSVAGIKASLSGFAGIDGRSQIIDRGYLLVNDTYNSNPLSSRYALRSVREIFPERRKIAVLSDMKELGKEAPACHRETGELVAGEGFDMLLVWGDMAGEYLDGAARGGLNNGRARAFDSKEELSGYLGSIVSDSDVVLVKGSRSMKMEEVVQALLK